MIGILPEIFKDSMLPINYVESESMTTQGKRDAIVKQYGKDWNIKTQGGNGNCLLTKKSNVLVNGKSHRSFILDHYAKSKLTRKLADKFRKDLEDGKVKLL